MWEDTIEGRDGKPFRILRWSDGMRDTITFDRLTDSQLRYWLRVFIKRPLYHETQLLRAECKRRRLSYDPRPGDRPDQLTIPWE